MHASTSYLECFRGVNLRRTEIAAMIYACQNLDGYTLANSSGYFFQRAGLSAKSAFSLGLGNYAIGVLTVMATWLLLPRVGRRFLFNLGLALTVAILLVIGGLGVPKPTAATGWATGGFCFLFNIVFHFGQGPLCYLLITDMPSTRLRPKTVVIARAAFLASAVFMVVLTNYQINVTAWNCEWRHRVANAVTACSILRSGADLQGEAKLGSSGPVAVLSCSSGPTSGCRRRRTALRPKSTGSSRTRFRRANLPTPRRSKWKLAEWKTTRCKKRTPDGIMGGNKSSTGTRACPYR